MILIELVHINPDTSRQTSSTSLACTPCVLTYYRSTVASPVPAQVGSIKLLLHSNPGVVAEFWLGFTLAFSGQNALGAQISTVLT